MLVLLPWLLAALSMRAAERPAGGAALDVPYVTQTEALCGGAAVAMVFRFWGDRHAGVNQFQSLVDRRAGGIATDVLVDAVRHRGWQATESSGSIEWLREEVAGGRPIVILLAEGRDRFHYVVVTAVEPDAVRLHDPTWGASRRMPMSDLRRRWAPTKFWSLRILPSAPAQDALGSGGAASVPCGQNQRPCEREPDPAGRVEEATGPANECPGLLADAIDEVRRRGLESADAVFGNVRLRCPDSAGPIRELAGVRFAERQWKRAADLAEQAIALDPDDAYAWEVLASSRFLQDDADGALRAWNQIGKPLVDSIHIEGLERTRHALVAQALGVSAETLLTPHAFRLAERRLQELPDRASARLGFRPQPDGFATIDVALTERALYPRGRIEWAAEAARTAVDREVTIALPERNGQGGLWTASWRWWNQRPRGELTFSAPRIGKLSGVWRVEASWDAQAYASPELAAPADVREERLHAGVTVSNWLTPNVRYQLVAGFDAWTDIGKTAAVGSTIERRLGSDRLALSADATVWLPVTTGVAFSRFGGRALFRSSRDTSSTIYIAEVGGESASSAAPLALWPGAGDGHARRPLLRAHHLLEDGVIRGPIFGRRLEYATLELQRWIPSSSPVRIGLAGFVDAAHSAHRAGSDAGRPFQADVGAGLRVRIPGRAGALRLDLARGVLDGARAVTVGWQF